MWFHNNVTRSHLLHLHKFCLFPEPLIKARINNEVLDRKGVRPPGCISIDTWMKQTDDKLPFRTPATIKFFKCINLQWLIIDSTKSPLTILSFRHLHFYNIFSDPASWDKICGGYSFYIFLFFTFPFFGLRKGDVIITCYVMLWNQINQIVP